MWLAGIELEIGGHEHLTAPRPRIVILNHSSTLDMVVVARLSPPRMMVVFKESLRWVFPLNLAFAMLGVVYVRRSAPGSTVGGMKRAAQRVREEVRSLALSPEGTRSRTGDLGPFKSGAFHAAQQAGAAIVPIVISGAHALCPPTGLRVQPGRIVVEVRPPRPPPSPDVDPQSLAAELHAAYLAWLEKDASRL